MPVAAGRSACPRHTGSVDLRRSCRAPNGCSGRRRSPRQISVELAVAAQSVQNETSGCKYAETEQHLPPGWRWRATAHETERCESLGRLRRIGNIVA
jgi:hypothetical protein